MNMNFDWITLLSYVFANLAFIVVLIGLALHFYPQSPISLETKDWTEGLPTLTATVVFSVIAIMVDPHSFLAVPTAILTMVIGTQLTRIIVFTIGEMNLGDGLVMVIVGASVMLLLGVLFPDTILREILVCVSCVLAGMGVMALFAVGFKEGNSGTNEREKLDRRRL
jgi:hypothetical protein